jgi:hypothetical protein
MGRRSLSKQQREIQAETGTDSGIRCASLLSEQIRNEPLPQGGGFEKMARRRYQKPAPKKRGKWWTILVREDFITNGQRTRKVRRILLAAATYTKAEAERLRDEYLAAVNHPNLGIGGACLFRDFAKTYERDILPTLASTSQERSKSVLKNHHLGATAALLHLAAIFGVVVRKHR